MMRRVFLKQDVSKYPSIFDLKCFFCNKDGHQHFNFQFPPGQNNQNRTELVLVQFLSASFTNWNSKQITLPMIHIINPALKPIPWNTTPQEGGRSGRLPYGEISIAGLL